MLNEKYLPKTYKHLPLPGIKKILQELPDRVADSLISQGSPQEVEKILTKPEAFSPIFQSILKSMLKEELPIFFDDSDSSIDTAMSSFLNSYFSEQLYMVLTNTVYAKVKSYLEEGDDEVYF
jgi:hypothetical protein